MLASQGWETAAAGLERAFRVAVPLGAPCLDFETWDSMKRFGREGLQCPRENWMRYL